MDTMSMPLYLTDLLARPDLNLSVTGAPAPGLLDRTIDAATVSDLLHPGEWLQGGELLMTIGLLLPMEPAACRAYVADVAAGGAAALALGLGHGLPYQAAPQPLVDAAQEAGLPLLTVPDEVPFIAVTKAVFEARAHEERQVLQRAFATQRRLTAAATDNGLRPMLEEWTAATGVGAAVLDPLGRLLASGGPDVEPVLDSARDLIDRVASRGLRGSAASTAGGQQLEVQPLGARRLRGLLLLSGGPDAAARAVVPGLVSLLSLELERRHLMDEPERRRRSALLSELLAEPEGGQERAAGRAQDILASVGLATERVRGVVVEAPPETAQEAAADLALAVPGGLVRVAEGGLVEAVVAEELDVRDVLGRFVPACPAGLGPPAAPEAVRASLRQAAGLLGLSRSSGAPVEARESQASRLLLELGDRRTLLGYADAVLSPLDLADSGEELIATLAAWLETGGSWDTTSRRLGVHRHTVRNRLDKAMALTGRRLDDADDRFDLWLATRIRRGGRV
ncbi:PucR family transcriptional regulator [Streptomyces sp. NPDC050315]|uniref:PucR family transcriptional regulator n=1 Tax=Streptomyces sp. NPDC050315 TaxID=3155039 RepID=UPI003435433E